MPERKSSKSSRATRPSSRSNTSRTSRSARTSTRAAKPASRAPKPEAPVTPSFEDEDEAPRSARPVAVGVARDEEIGDDVTDDADVQDAAPEAELGADGEQAPGELEAGESQPGAPVVVERPQDELLAGVACVLIAASVFLPWYHGVLQRNISGWSSGTWGPITFFLALAGAAIVGLRRAHVAVSFPLEHSLILEGIGWFTVVAVLLKRILTPHVAGFPVLRSNYIFVTMILGVALAFAGGRTSATAPFVIKPGWLQAAGGKLGAALLAGALAIGVVFGFVVSASPATSQQATPPPQNLIRGRVPDCMTHMRFPIASGVRPSYGQEAGSGASSICFAIFTSKLSVSKLVSAEEAKLRAAGWKFSVQRALVKGQPPGISIASPQCGVISFLAATSSKQRSMSVNLRSCPAGRATP